MFQLAWVDIGVSEGGDENYVISRSYNLET